MSPRKKRNSIKTSAVVGNMLEKTPKKTKRSAGKNKPDSNDFILESIYQRTTLIDTTRKDSKRKRKEDNKPDKNDFIPESIDQHTALVGKTRRGSKRKRKEKNGSDEKNFIQETIGQDCALPSPDRRNKYSRNFRTSTSCSVHDSVFVMDKSVANADFIPLTMPKNASKKWEGEYSENSRTVSETVVSCSTSEKAEDSVAVIVVDDDDDYDDDCNSVCIEEVKNSIDCESVNDSVQIITNSNDCESVNDSVQIIMNSNDCEEKNRSGKNTFTTNISPSNRRKHDDSIEILEPGDLNNIPSKKSRNSSSTISNVVILEHCDSDGTPFVKKSRNCVNAGSSLAVSSTTLDISDEDKTLYNRKQDDDIIIVDSVVKNSKDCVILNDNVPARISPSKSKWRKTTTYHIRDRNLKSLGNNPNLSSVFQDTVGNTQKISARYKSPLSRIANQDSDTNVSYHNVYGNNMYNPNNVEKTGLRPVVIDGSNVAFGHGGKRFSVRGIEICVNYFVKRGHNVVIAFVPLFRRSEMSDTDRKILDDLHNKRQLAFTPSRFLHGRRVTSYDDRFIVQCAAELGGIIVSTDNYRDLVSENEAWRETIEKRLLMFTWVGDILMFPDDPNGRVGPRLEEFLRFP